MVTALAVQRATKLARVLGNPVRLLILLALREKPMCVTELMGLLKRPQANVSQHLMVLRAAGIVIADREGMKVKYRIRNRKMDDLLDKIVEIAASFDELDYLDGMRRKPCEPRVCNR